MHVNRAMMWALMSSLAGPLAAGTAAALDYCVSCAKPDAHYNCRIDVASANPRDLRLQLMCISQIAAAGGHETCAVDSPQPPTCPGTLKVVAAPDGIQAPPPIAEPKDAAAAATPPPPANNTVAAPAETVVPKAPKPPKTVQEMVEKGAASTGKNLEEAGGAVKDTAKSAGGILQKAGSAVSNAAKKTWICVTSLFGDC